MNTSATVERIRAYDFGGHSDEALRRILSRFARDTALLRKDCLLPIVYAVVNEAVRRRLGIWRIFDADFDLPLLAQYDSAAQEIVERGSYKTHPSYYTDDAYLEGPAFRRAVELDSAMSGLGDDDRAIVHGDRLRLREGPAYRGLQRHAAGRLLPCAEPQGHRRRDALQPDRRAA